MDIFTLVGKIALEGAEAAQKQLSGLEEYAERNKKGLMAMGAAMTGAGVAIVGALGLATKAAQNEDINIKRLGVSLKNVGVNYDDVKDSMEAVITATQRKTGIADSEQRDILGRLLLVTNDYNKALQLMPLALDLAAAGQMDANTAATYLGKAMLELEGGAESVSVRLGQATVQFKSLAEIQERVGGAAQAAADPFKILTAEIGDMAEDIGRQLLPILKSAIDAIMPIIAGIRTWAQEHPELTKTIVLLAAALGSMMAILGPLVFLLPQLTAGVAIFGAAMTVATGPVGLIILAIMGLVAAGVLLWQNWDTIKDKLGDFWTNVSNTFKTGVNFLITLAENWANSFIKATNFIIGALNRISFSVPDWVPGIGGKEWGINIPTVPEINIPRLARGGMIEEPSWVVRMRDMKPVAIAGEAGAEAVVPFGRMGNIIITGNNFNVRTDRDIDRIAEALVGKIRLQQGLRGI